MRVKILSLFIVVSGILFAQKKTCDGPKEEVLEDLNSISFTKCSIEDSKKTKNKKSRQISVRVSARKKHFFKKRPVNRSAASNINAVESSGLASTNHSTQIKGSTIALLNTLSEEQVRKAARFSTVDEVPGFKKCKSSKGDDRLDCFNQEMMNHINKHFQYPGDAVRENLQGEVWVRFVIDTDGKVTNVRTLGPDGGEVLDNEAKRVVSKLSDFIPAKIKGKPVSVKYGFPINFSLEQE